MFPKDILQIIGVYSNVNDFIKLYELYDVSVDIYLKYTAIIYLIHSNHKFMDHLIKKNILCNKNVCDYALKYDIPKYIRLHNDETYGLYAQYKNHQDFDFETAIQIPNIIKHNYTQHGFRFNKYVLNSIFRNNDVELIKFVQNYPQKSDVVLFSYAPAYGDTLWKLNYKHKLAYLLIKYSGWHIPLTLLCAYGVFRTLYNETDVPLVFAVSFMCAFTSVSIVKKYVMHKLNLLCLPL